MSQPQKNGGNVVFTSEDTIVVVFDGPGDTTRRPRRPNNPREWPPQKPTPKPPPDNDQPPPDASGR
jgi:hypothetical protein